MPKNAKVIITTNKEMNDSVLRDRNIKLITIEPFDQEEAKEFIEKSIKKETGTQPNNLQILYDLIFKYFKTEIRPYILSKLMTIINLEINVSTFIEKFNNQMVDDLLKEDKLFELLKGFDESTLNLLYYCSYMSSDLIPAIIFQDILKIDKEEVILAAKILRKNSLICNAQKNRIKGIRINRFIQEEIKRLLERRNDSTFIIKLIKQAANIFALEARDNLNKLEKKENFLNFINITENINLSMIKDELITWEEYLCIYSLSTMELEMSLDFYKF